MRIKELFIIIPIKHYVSIVIPWNKTMMSYRTKKASTRKAILNIMIHTVLMEII